MKCSSPYYFVEQKKTHLSVAESSGDVDIHPDDKEVNADEINELLGTDPMAKQDEDELGGKTVSIAELDVLE